MAQLTNAAIQGYKQFTIVSGKYRIGNTYYPLTILSKEILPNGKMLIRVQCDHPTEHLRTLKEYGKIKEWKKWKKYTK